MFVFLKLLIELLPFSIWFTAEFTGAEIHMTSNRRTYWNVNEHAAPTSRLRKCDYLNWAFEETLKLV
jgi:hypothetical protein